MSASDSGHAGRWVRYGRGAARFVGSAAGVAVVSVVVLGLGYWGLARLPGPGGSALDRAYETLQLLGIQGDVPATGTPWPLDVGRFGAPLLLPYAAAVAFVAVATGRAQKLRLGLVARNHILIVGIGERGATLARALRDRYHVVGIELDSGNGKAASLRKSGVPVVIGDASDARALRRARPGRAARIVVVAGDDSVNLEILATARKLAGPDGVVPTHVAIDSPELWSELHRLPFAGAAGPRRVDFFNVPDRVADLLVEAAVADHLLDPARGYVLRGSGLVLARLTVRLLRSAALADGGAPTRLLIESPDAQAMVKLLRHTDPWVFEHADVRTEPEEAQDLVSGLGFVCGLAEAEALEAGISLRRRMPDASKVLVAFPDEDTGVALEELGVDLGVRLVPTTSRLLTEELFEEAAFERLARGRHEEHNRQQRGNGRATVRWEDDAASRLASHRYAEGVGEMLAGIGAQLVPLTGRRVGTLELSDGARHHLAVLEHNRWWRDKLRDGVTDHPCMVPWDELPDGEQAKDHDSIRILPALLAEIGYEVVLPGAEEVDRRIGAAPDPRAFRPGPPDHLSPVREEHRES